MNQRIKLNQVRRGDRVDVTLRGGAHLQNARVDAIGSTQVVFQTDTGDRRVVNRILIVRLDTPAPWPTAGAKACTADARTLGLDPRSY